MLEKLKLYWKQIAAVLSTIIGYVLLKEYFQKDLKAELKNAEVSSDSAVLDAKEAAEREKAELAQAANDAQLTKLKGTLQDLKKDSPTQVEEYWKKN